ncbi:MAG: flp pilus-assembly TadE/G-like family protein [Gordonia sp. (in: high G+C Gram-positive bacteria)]|uniref:Rv3654c family TadE-like protein n=1 Tax=Gordonia sp. (in: high G+C Gram-positive bacteria) TaxID=84139 RepID=UPI0039E71063
MWPPSNRRQLTKDDDGFATLAAAGVIAALTALLVGMLYLGGAVLARHRAQSAADLSALAAAAVHVRGDAEPCAAARDLAAEQGTSAEVTSCRTDGQDVLVEVTVPVLLGRWGPGRAIGRARAGP